MSGVVEEILWRSGSVAETVGLGVRLGAGVSGGMCILLRGMLGAGKTQLVRGIAAGARVMDAQLVSSPTYVLLNVYPRRTGEAGSKTVYHIDAYRTQGSEDFEAVGLDELLAEPEGVVVVEWPERIEDLLPAERVEVAIEAVDETSRELRVKGIGARAAAMVRKL